MNHLSYKLRKLVDPLLSGGAPTSKRVAILSNDQYAYGLKDDMLLKFALRRLGIVANIISWKDKSVDYSSYHAAVVRSTWGYHRELLEFREYLQMLEGAGVRVINSPTLMLENINKERQYSVLTENGINCIQTEFLHSAKDLRLALVAWGAGTGVEGAGAAEVGAEGAAAERAGGARVVKPVVSASGDDTYLLEQLDEGIIAGLSRIADDPDNGLLLQEYIPEVAEGEVSLVFIDGAYSHAVMRQNAILTDKQASVREFLGVTPELRDLGERVIALFPEAVYARLDFVQHLGEWLIMEVELVEPSLFYYVLEDNSCVRLLAEAVARELD
jgi:glutathione synthase/RimK-type ligase-like ATP-grasp enzyme